MNTDEARQKWLAQLRSPDAKKTTGKLEDFDDRRKRCCLGHACHALGESRRESISGHGKAVVQYGYDRALYQLPDSAAELLDITTSGRFKNAITVKHTVSGYEGFSRLMTCLSDLNDDTTLTPSEIADVIEEQFKTDNFVPFGRYKMTDKDCLEINPKTGDIK